MTDDEAKQEENRNRMRALALDGMQSIREGDIAGGAECLEMFAKRTVLGEASRCPRCRYRARWMRTYTLVSVDLLHALHASLAFRSSWKTRMRLRWLTVRGLWALAVLHLRMRLVLPFVRCRCPKEER